MGKWISGGEMAKWVKGKMGKRGRQSSFLFAFSPFRLLPISPNEGER
jgi:hypothetical protein